LRELVDQGDERVRMVWTGGIWGPGWISLLVRLWRRPWEIGMEMEIEAGDEVGNDKSHVLDTVLDQRPTQGIEVGL
jgi:hypothetical protein